MPSWLKTPADDVESTLAFGVVVAVASLSDLRERVRQRLHSPTARAQYHANHHPRKSVTWEEEGLLWTACA